MGKKSNKMVATILVMALAMVALVSVYYAYSNGMFPGQSAINTGPTPTPTGVPSTKTYSLTLPTVFTVNDAWNGSTMNSVTVTLYRSSDLKQLETGSTSGGTYTSTNPLMSGDTYYVKLSKTGLSGSGTGFKWYQITVPTENSASAAAHYIGMSYYSFFGASGLSMKIYNDTGGQVYDYTSSAITNQSASYLISVATGNKYPSFNVMIGPPSTDNSGIQNMFDPTMTGYTDRQILLAVQLGANTSDVGVNHLMVTSMNALYTTSASNKVYGTTIPDTAFQKIKNADGTYANTGISTQTLNFDASGIQSTDHVSVTITLYGFDNWAWYQAHGTDETGSVALADTFDFYINGSA